MVEVKSSRATQRRAFLRVGARTAVGALAVATGGPNLLLAKDRMAAESGLEKRVADIIVAHDSQGNHRTGTPVDAASAEWLAKQVEQIGAEVGLEPFALSRVRSAVVLLAHRRSAH